MIKTDKPKRKYTKSSTKQSNVVKKVNFKEKKKGQREKSEVLEPFNCGKPFQILKLQTLEGDIKYGIQDERQKDKVWVDKDIITTDFSCFAVVNPIYIDTPNSNAYSSQTVTIGGVGKHIRWKTVLPQIGRKTCPDLLITNISDEDSFRQFMERLKPFAFISALETIEDDLVSHVSIPDSTYLGNIAAMFHANGFGAVSIDEEFEETCGKLGIERKDRSDHMWWNQSKREAGPLRDTHRWDYSFLPKDWRSIPFTWESMTDNIYSKINVTNVMDLPLPLRNYVVQYHISRCESELDILQHELVISYIYEVQQLKRQIRIKRKEIEDWSHFTKSRHCVTCRLTKDQNIQLLTSTYWRVIAPFDDFTLKMTEILAFRYCVHGFEGREVGPYRQSAKYLGHGETIRNFKNHKQYKPENMPTDVLNKVYKSDGKLQGSGSKGSRGKYGNRKHPRYQQNKRGIRCKTIDKQIRSRKIDCFREYEETSTVQA